MTLSELAVQEYEDLSRKLKINFTPAYPGVLVRVLPKEHMSAGGIVLPDTKQNKPIYEGIVLRTYPPKRLKLDSGKWITMDSGLSLGDHILFAHWSGEPVPWLRDALGAKAVENEDYRLIPARGFLSLVGMKDGGEPFLILNYEKETVDQKLKEILTDLYTSGKEDNPFEDEAVAKAIVKIKKEFDILVAQKASKTISGE